MVTSSQLRRDTEEYSLSEVRVAANAHLLDFGGWVVQSDIAALQYSIEEVCRCLAELEEGDFSHSECYPDNPRWHDVYKVTRQGEVSGKKHDLYIKFRMNGQRITIVLCSFHPQRGTYGR